MCPSTTPGRNPSCLRWMSISIGGRICLKQITGVPEDDSCFQEDVGQSQGNDWMWEVKLVLYTSRSRVLSFLNSDLSSCQHSMPYRAIVDGDSHRPI
jgi:hypothetical protein